MRNEMADIPVPCAPIEEAERSRRDLRIICRGKQNEEVMPMEMTRERLEMYRNNKAEISELKEKLKHLGEGDSMLKSDVVMDYRKGYPQPSTIVGYDYDLECKRRRRYQEKIAELEAEQDNIEEFVFGIPNGRTRRIFQLYFLEGKNQKEVAAKVHLDQSRISRKIDDYLKNA